MSLDQALRFSVAPMMEWTDRECRMLHRLLCPSALLYTEMVGEAAVRHGPTERLLAFSPEERPLALQLGGSDPEGLASAVRLACAHGYDEINLNVGCPSDRVQSGAFGACLMRRPGLVAECVTAMIDAARGAGTAAPEITVKCRIGVDEQDPAEALPAFLSAVAAAGVRRVIVHARKAWLSGLSPKENRDVPPLDYPLVAKMRAAFPALQIVLNGGIPDLDAAAEHLEAGVAGVMLGRAAYHEPFAVLGRAESRIFGRADPQPNPEAAVEAMRPYIDRRLGEGVRLHQITRHMLGLFNGRPGARAWRRILSSEAVRPGAGLEVLDHALEPLRRAAA
ncbi:MAG: tRNA dihydrouridine(20/20a) synthase DusA [Pseudomonadota bacterium]